MRLRGLFIVLIVLLAGHAAAQAPRDPDAGLRGAVAPAQTVVEAAARAISLATEEADRDGTPDKALEILARVDAFIQDLKVDWRVSARATYQEEAELALAYAIDVAEALRGLPAATALTATSVVDCDVSGGSTARHATLLLATGQLDAARARLLELAPHAPPGVDASSLAAASARLLNWTVEHRVVERCAMPQEPYLLLTASPSVTHPLGRVRLVGSTNADNLVEVTIPALGFSERVVVADERFHHEFIVPADVPLGNVTVRAMVSELEARANLTVSRAPSQLIVRGSGTVAVGHDATYAVYLVSPLQDRVDNATVVVEGATNVTLPLGRGGGRYSFAAPDQPQNVTIVFTYAGDDLVQPAKHVLRISVEVPARPVVEQERDRAGATTALPSQLTLGLLAALAVGLLALWIVRRFRRTLRPPRATSDPAPEVAPTATPGRRAASTGLVALFASLVLWLRARGTVPASATAREVGATLQSRGIPVDEAVRGFELTRYGGGGLSPNTSEGLVARLQAAWVRVKEAFA